MVRSARRRPISRGSWGFRFTRCGSASCPSGRTTHRMCLKISCATAYGGVVYPSNPHVQTDAPPAPREFVYVAQGPGTWRELWAWIAEDWRVHERDWTRPGFRAVALHRFGNFRMRIKPFLLRAPLSFVYWS